MWDTYVLFLQEEFCRPYQTFFSCFQGIFFQKAIFLFHQKRPPPPISWRPWVIAAQTANPLYLRQPKMPLHYRWRHNCSLMTYQLNYKCTQDVHGMLEKINCHKIPQCVTAIIRSLLLEFIDFYINRICRGLLFAPLIFLVQCRTLLADHGMQASKKTLSRPFSSIEWQLPHWKHGIAWCIMLPIS